MLNIGLPKYFMASKMNFDKYEGLSNPRKHIQNMRSSLELVMQDLKVMYKVFPITFKRSTRAWYHNLKPGD